MEENNRKGSGVFYAVVGVATLVVAIIGATFAYFSATAEVGGEQIKGNTENLKGALSVKVSKVNLGTNEERQVASDNLVPSNIAGTTAENINAVLTAKCANNGYSACHIFKIEAKSTTTVTAVDLRLATLTTTATDNGNWKYVIYRGSDTAATEVPVTATAFNALPKDGQVIRSTGLTENVTETYYLMVFITNIASSQNEGGTNDVTGSYEGTVTMTAAGGGQVSATFASQQA